MSIFVFKRGGWNYHAAISCSAVRNCHTEPPVYYVTEMTREDQPFTFLTVLQIDQVKAFQQRVTTSKLELRSSGGRVK